MCVAVMRCAVWKVVCWVCEEWEAVEELLDWRRNGEDVAGGRLGARRSRYGIGIAGFSHHGCVVVMQCVVAKSSQL
jgi:hypothetical protein